MNTSSFFIGYFIGFVSLAFFLMLCCSVEYIFEKIRALKLSRSQSNDEGKDL